MSTTATVFDFTPAQLQRTVGRKPGEPSAESTFSIFDDLADGIEAIHQCANLAGFSERPRAFILALATAAHSQSTSCVELYDEELAELQNCSARTVARQRADYLRESRSKNFDFVEIIEGEFDKEAKRYSPTMYRFHLGSVVERIVSAARESTDWHQWDRRRQREALKRAASHVYDEIPEAPPKRRKKRRLRPTIKEMETDRKVIEAKFRSLKEKAARLPPGERERLLNAELPGELHEWWLQLRAEMDSFFNVDSPQPIDSEEFDRDGRQLVRYPPASVDAAETAQTSVEEAELVTVNTLNIVTTAPEASAAWEQIEERLTAPQIRRVEIELLPPEPAAPGVSDTLSCESEPSAPDTLAQTREPEIEPTEIEPAETEACRLEAPGIEIDSQTFYVPANTSLDGLPLQAPDQIKDMEYNE